MYVSVPIFPYVPPHLLPDGNHKFIFYLSNSVLYIRSFVTFFFNSTYKQYPVLSFSDLPH